MLILTVVAAAIAESYLSENKIIIVSFELDPSRAEYWLLRNNQETIIFIYQL